MRHNSGESRIASSVLQVSACLMLFAASGALLIANGCGGSASTNGGGGGSATIRGTIAVGTAPSAIAVDSTTNTIYVVDFGTVPTGIPCSPSGADVEVIDGATQSKTSVDFYPPVQVNATGAALNPTSHTLYVQTTAYWNGIKGNSSCGVFAHTGEVFDTTSFQPPNGQVDALAGVGIAVNPVTGNIYLTDGGVGPAADVFVLDSDFNHLATIPLGSVPIGVVVNATSNRIYVANSASNNISVIDGASNSVVATVTDPNAVAPVAIAVNPTTNSIYVANSKSNNVTVIDGATNSVTATVPVGTSPSGVAVNSQTNFIYVANSGSNDISVMNGATNATTTLSDPNAKNPVAVAANAITSKIYVANSGTNNVTVIDGAH